ncbi:inositol monophosphatase family protein [Marinivivus vitaminiproducens]|uniref:inositol monophosphatase family protein n=1 Tax=Marinivivus vitaminiproducens TaxID=3035935 RepID=UPI0027A2886A|nr:inositol monophosphatase [Geminicoccaceae bacterium SCSIO 64248]
MMLDLDQRTAIAAAIMREAGQRALAYFRDRGRLAVERKGLQDLVSIADREVETIIRAGLERSFPGEAILGEEGGGSGDAERLWIIDPIDGTANFLRGIPYWSMVLGYVEDGRVQVGVTYDPVHDELFVASAGNGARRDGEAIAVSGVSDPGAACVGLSYTFKTPTPPYIDMVAKALGEGFDHRRMGSSALALAHVADGRLDALMVPYANMWDVVSGLILVEEAGGFVTPFRPEGGLTRPSAILACTPALAPLLQRISGITGEGTLT